MVIVHQQVLALHAADLHARQRHPVEITAEIGSIQRPQFQRQAAAEIVGMAMIGNLGCADNHAVAVDRISIETRQGQRRTVLRSDIQQSGGRHVHGRCCGTRAAGHERRHAVRPLEGGRIVTPVFARLCESGMNSAGPPTLGHRGGGPIGICMA